MWISTKCDYGLEAVFCIASKPIGRCRFYDAGEDLTHFLGAVRGAKGGSLVKEEPNPPRLIDLFESPLDIGRCSAPTPGDGLKIWTSSVWEVAEVMQIRIRVRLDGIRQSTLLPGRRPIEIGVAK